MDEWTEDQKQRILYAAGHLISSIAYPDDAHAADSSELAFEIFEAIAEEIKPL